MHQTPKQKVKLKVTEDKLLNLMLKYNGGKPRSKTKLKSAIQLQDLLDATRMLVPRNRSHVFLSYVASRCSSSLLLIWKQSYHGITCHGLSYGCYTYLSDVVVSD